MKKLFFAIAQAAGMTMLAGHSYSQVKSDPATGFSPSGVSEQRKFDPKVGGACRVTRGRDSGQTGTYTREGNGNWWCSTNGGHSETECTGGRCENARTATTVFEIAWDGKNSAVIARQSNPREGGRCRVTAGGNAGQTGTYTQASDGTWWCKTNGGRTETECTGGRCEDARTATPQGAQVQVEVVSAVFYIPESKTLLQSINIVDKATGKVVRTATFPIEINNVNDFKNSGDGLEQIIAKSVATHVKEQK